MEMPATGHEPVLLREILDHLSPTNGQVFVDCTIGRGGHALAIAQRLGPTGLLIGIDADPRNLEFAARQLKQYDTPLDMRLDPADERSAADLVNYLPETDLAAVLYELAQERYSRRIARKIVEQRQVSPIKTTDALAELVRSAVPRRRGPPPRMDPATRTFLALRMAVNREMENLAAMLKLAPPALAPAGRLAVISFQSMEDRAVKQAFRSLEQTGFYAVLTRKPLSPTPEEIAANPRARSAKLRVIQNIEQPL